MCVYLTKYIHCTPVLKACEDKKNKLVSDCAALCQSENMKSVNGTGTHQNVLEIKRVNSFKQRN